MKKVLATGILALTVGATMAAERKSIAEVDTDAMTNETQLMPKGAGEDHMALTWWIPDEFWEAVMTQDSTSSEADREETLGALSGVSLLAVVQADISAFGAFDFYSEQEIGEHLSVSFVSSGGESVLPPIVEINPDLKILLGVLTPILEGAMGNLGKNLHFFVLNDRKESSPRIVDPYEQGILSSSFEKRSGDPIATHLELPLDSLFVPRKCPNGKEAHVSWAYCPWSGKKLGE